MRPSSLVRLLAAGLTAACAATQPELQPRPVSTDLGAVAALGEIGRVAAIIRDNHVTPVPNDVTLGAAARALDAEAKTEVVPSESTYFAIRNALARVRAARPDLDLARIVGIAAAAMAEALHDNSLYLGPDEALLSPPMAAASVGLVLRRREGSPLIVRAIPDSPAALAAIAAGLELRAVDHRLTAGVALEDVVALLRGPTGSEITLTLGKPGGAARDIVLRRAPVDGDVVDCRVVDGKILYLGIPALRAGIRERVASFAAAAGPAAERIIIDLRGNTGGLFDSARDLGDAFLDSGTILSVKRRLLHDIRDARRDDTPLERARVAVLVDRVTGSGAEAVAAAIQDNNRGKVIGRHTSSRASIDVIYDLRNGGKLRLTIGRLMRASGEPIDGRGVEPDIVIDENTPAGRRLSDVSCPGVVSVTPVADDPVVAAAVAQLR